MTALPSMPACAIREEALAWLTVEDGWAEAFRDLARTSVDALCSFRRGNTGPFSFTRIGTL
jgi:hypothetical protein